MQHERNRRPVGDQVQNGGVSSKPHHDEIGRSQQRRSSTPRNSEGMGSALSETEDPVMLCAPGFAAAIDYRLA
jgi:hypothetical protein